MQANGATTSTADLGAHSLSGRLRRSIAYVRPHRATSTAPVSAVPWIFAHKIRSGSTKNTRREGELGPSERVEAVKEKLGEPLLVDPLSSLRPDGERVVGGEAVLDDLAPAENRQPAVLEELARQIAGESDQEERNDGEEQGLAT